MSVHVVDGVDDLLARLGADVLAQGDDRGRWWRTPSVAGDRGRELLQRLAQRGLGGIPGFLADREPPRPGRR